MSKLSDKLLEVCNKHVEPGKNTMDKMCRSLPRLISSRSHYFLAWDFVDILIFFCSKFSSIIVPLQSSMTVTLPGSCGEVYEHDPFPGEQPVIVQFEEKVKCTQSVMYCNSKGMFVFFQVEVLASLQRPKKITVSASDGKSYVLLCKPKVQLVIDRSYVLTFIELLSSHRMILEKMLG